ncbi:MAG: hypothetical protein R3F14_01720 [Polyangiaceae bacterium]
MNVKKAMGTPRQMGRFALELWVGKELLDRARFDVPLLGDDDRERDPKRPRKKPTFARVTAKVKVQMADHPRATVLAFVDRATGDAALFLAAGREGALTPFSAKAAFSSSTQGERRRCGGCGTGDASDASTGETHDAGPRRCGSEAMRVRAMQVRREQRRSMRLRGTRALHAQMMGGGRCWGSALREDSYLLRVSFLAFSSASLVRSSSRFLMRSLTEA